MLLRKARPATTYTVNDAFSIVMQLVEDEQGAEGGEAQLLFSDEV